MPIVKQRNVWMILDHPWQLFLALAIAKAAPSELRFHIIASKHKYWSRVDINAYRQYFGNILFFDEPKRARNLFDAFRFLRRCKKLKKELADLPIKPSDTLLTLCYYTYLENLLTSVFSGNRQIFIIRDDIYQIFDIFQSNLKKGVYREAKSSLLHRRLLEPLLGLKKKTRFLWINTPENFHDLTLDRRPEVYYNSVFRLRSQAANELSREELYYPYPLLLKASGEPIKRKRAVFFLSDYVKNPDYYRKISKILRALAEHFGDALLLELRVHPNRLDEPKLVQAEGWQINRESGSAEEYLLTHREALACAFSHLSTVLLFATQLGIPAYTYYRLFEFTLEYRAIFDRIYRDMPKEFFMTSYEQVPQKYEIPIKTKQVRQSLNKLFNVLTR